MCLHDSRAISCMKALAAAMSAAMPCPACQALHCSSCCLALLTSLRMPPGLMIKTASVQFQERVALCAWLGSILRFTVRAIDCQLQQLHLEGSLCCRTEPQIILSDGPQPE